MNKTKNHIMLDLETLSLDFNAAILSVGAALFDLDGNVEPLYHRRINLSSCLKAGLHVDGATVEWWVNQKEENRMKLFSIPSKELGTVLWELNNEVCMAIPMSTCRYVWSHGINYDTVVYENACKKMNTTIWWNYKNVRDTRTLFDMANYKYESKGGHDALDDAMNQAKAVCEAYQLLKGRVENGSN